MKTKIRNIEKLSYEELLDKRDEISRSTICCSDATCDSEIFEAEIMIPCSAIFNIDNTGEYHEIPEFTDQGGIEDEIIYKPLQLTCRSRLCGKPAVLAEDMQATLDYYIENEDERENLHP